MSIPPIAHKARAVRSRGEHSTSRFVRCQILDPSFPVALQVQYELAAKPPATDLPTTQEVEEEPVTAD